MLLHLFRGRRFAESRAVELPAVINITHSFEKLKQHLALAESRGSILHFADGYSDKLSVGGALE